MSVLLEVNGINVTFDGFKAINNLSLSISNNELRAIIGPNGAGKTTFMDIVTGKTKPDSGTILWGQKNSSLLRMNEAQIVELGISRKFQKPTLIETQTVFENLLLSLKKSRNPIATLFYKMSPDDEKEITNIAVEVNLIENIGSLAGQLSHGQKQWLEIGMLLAQKPNLLLIDEPAAGMTSPERKKTVKLLKKLSKNQSIVVVEHDMEFVKSLECRVTVLHEGTVIAEGSLDHVSQNEKVIDVYLGR
ncbi:urea ABC transporter ATP-binding protein UrtD [Alphaproteobacteria bacterium]|jgi:urea transport system ATP-binding protein|nr:urea ABC transporter ATP-binding protein UrtD [Alphaproteobacteria bacterium]MDA7545942.1 urea ABC transporter ATP-binding protein UrtD [Alphaproteobacteria bacterium]MDB2696909.1 urea ABC transporter ATP-binding protein UrtD [Alphaproteobacteria bacterium]MDB3914808.1 urea ABC transporter ATP-binding protein UrtD [Alphaproteobacteria bacterium]MDC0976185.1 urea ABC transporter ATP-binding protein UrtD [Alphaproteobacteria bacterium]